MSDIEALTSNVIVNAKLQKNTRSCVLGGVKLGKTTLIVETGNTIKDSQIFRKQVEDHFKVPIKYLFLTHTHNDHRGGLEVYPDCMLIMSEKSKENMPKRISLKKYSKKTFEEKYILDEDEYTIEFYRTAGHSIGHSVAYFPEDKVLFGGDLFIVGSANFGLPFMSFYQNKPRRTGNPEEYITAYEKFKEMTIDFIVPGHGEIVRNPADILDLYLEFFVTLRNHFRNAIEDGLTYKEIEYPNLEIIDQAYEKVRDYTPPSKAKRFLDHYLEVLKDSYYNYYSGKFH